MLAKVESNNEKFLAGGSQLSELINGYDWSLTPLGAIENWPQSLKTSVNLILNSQHPMWIGWGREVTFLYNDAYIQVLSLAKHPSALGKPASEVWSEIWDFCGPLADRVFKEGIPTYVDDVRLFMNRGDFFEETYYSFSYSPIYDETGKVAGLFCPSAETTAKVLHTRRLKTLSELSSSALIEKTTRGACASAFETLQKNPDDIPFAVLYLIDADRKIMHLEAHTGISHDGMALFPELIAVSTGNGATLWPVADVLKSRSALTVSVDDLEGLPSGCAGYDVAQAIVLPVISAGQDAVSGILIAGVNPCRKVDADYRTFYDLLSNQIAIAIQNARAAEEERKRLEMLAEIDRAKTVFFSNVSHEFRTPLTLILGPLELILAKSAHLLPAEDREGLHSTHRNTMRLFRLVNTLLDFSRIEAGRITAAYAPVNLAKFTADLASNFRSVIENAQLEFDVDCRNIAEPVYIDRGMWEKIVFNLLSNAFRFTMQGRISVSLFQNSSSAILKVADTGIGIPPEELPRLFERFYRVRNAVGRTFEGTGIGLSLVKELVLLHKGTIDVESQPGRGTTFTVSIPLGKDHLPDLAISEVQSTGDESSLANVYVRELESLMGSNGHESKQATPQPTSATHDTKKNKVLIVDDNADMRHYIKRMLMDTYILADADNGRSALSKIEEFQPDLVITDVMMPVMDGIELLHTLKSNPSWSHIPVIVLSARAGEEARIEGYELGADDYLVKPFSVNELLARVKAQIRIARVRRHAETHLRNFFQQAPIIIVVLRGPTFIVEIANEKLLEYWGRTLDETLHKPLLEVLPEISQQGLTELLTNVMTTGNRRIENEREVPLFRNGKQETTYVSYVYEPLRNDEGEVTHVMVLANDVTDSVLARKKIEASEKKFRNLVRQAPVGIAILRGREFLVEIANDSYLEIANRKPEDLIGKRFFEQMHELRDSELPKFLNYVLDTGESYFGSEFPVEFYRGGKLDLAYFNFVYQPLLEGQEVSGVICVVVEVTEIVKARKMAQQVASELELRVEERTRELKVSNQKLEASNQELEQFAYIASHDLQEPLRKIQTFSELLQRHIEDRPVVEKYITKIDVAAARMSGLIRDVLNYSKLHDNGEVFQPVDLNEVFRNVIADLELMIQEANAVVECDTLPVVSGIRLQLHQLFSNLIGNSLKFSRDLPTIKITSELVVADNRTAPMLTSGRKYVLLTFSDNGIGFDQEYAEKIFVIFQRLNYNTKQTGTGIGLALCKKIVDGHGGSIEAIGVVNKGATFKVHLPVEHE